MLDPALEDLTAPDLTEETVVLEDVVRDVAAAPVSPGSRFTRTFESLKDRDFRWFFLAMSGHFTAMNVQLFIQGFLVFRLTGSHAALGFVQLAGAFPMLVFSTVGGVIADMIPQKKWMVQIGQTINAVNTAWITYFLFVDGLTVEHLVIAALVQGVINSLMMPSRQAMIPEVAGERMLMNALALNTAGMNFARLVMPGMAGYMIALLGTGAGTSGAEWVYLMMTGLYLWSVLSLFMVPNFDGVKERERTIRKALTDVVEGFRYIRDTPTVRAVLLVNLLMVLTSMPYFFLLPGFVEEVLGGGSMRLGILMSVQGVGSLVGSLVIASMMPKRRGHLLLVSGFLMAVALFLFFWTTWIWASAVLLTIVGLCHAVRMTLSNVLVQAYASVDYRGRVMSVYMMEFSIVMVGVFLVGLAADRFGAQEALSATAIALLAVMTYAWFFVPTFRHLD